MKFRLLHIFSLVLVIAVAVGATWAWAQTDETIYYACVNNSSGTIKVFMEETPCNENEMPINWNQTGPPGPSGISEAFTTSHGDAHFTADEAQDILVLDLPPGDYISDITIQGSYDGTGHAFIECWWDKEVDGVRSPLGGWSVGGTMRPDDQETFARTFDFDIFADDEDAKVWVYCDPFFSDPPGDITLHHSSWTVIKADTIHNQPWPPGD